MGSRMLVGVEVMSEDVCVFELVVDEISKMRIISSPSIDPIYLLPPPFNLTTPDNGVPYRILQPSIAQTDYDAYKSQHSNAQSRH